MKAVCKNGIAQELLLKEAIFVIFVPKPCSWQCLLLPEGAHGRAEDVGCCCAMSQLALTLGARAGEFALLYCQNYLQTAELSCSAGVPCAVEICLNALLYLSNKKAFRSRLGLCCYMRLPQL